MKLLLDTHIWLWSVLEPERLSSRVKRELANLENELWLSSISVWELSFLQRKGRMQLPYDVPGWVATSMKELRLSEAPLTIEIVFAVSSLDFPHADPADHFIASTAKALKLTLVTADTHLIELPGIKVLPNR